MSYLSAIVHGYLPQKMKHVMSEFVFEKLHGLHSIAETKKQKTLVLKNMISFGITEKTIKKLKDFYEECLEKKDFAVGKHNLHVILFKISA